MKNVLIRLFLFIYTIVKLFISLYKDCLDTIPRMTIAFTIYTIIRLLF